MNGEKNKDLELQKFYDAEGNEITMLDPVMKEGISTKESVRQMYKKLQDDYRSRAGAPRSIRDMDIEQFKKLYGTDKDFKTAVDMSRYSKGLKSAIRKDRGM